MNYVKAFAVGIFLGWTLVITIFGIRCMNSIEHIDARLHNVNVRIVR